MTSSRLSWRDGKHTTEMGSNVLLCFSSIPLLCSACLICNLVLSLSFELHYLQLFYNILIGNGLGIMSLFLSYLVGSKVNFNHKFFMIC